MIRAQAQEPTNLNPIPDPLVLGPTTDTGTGFTPVTGTGGIIPTGHDDWSFPFTLITEFVPVTFWSSFSPPFFAALLVIVPALILVLALGVRLAPAYGLYAGAATVIVAPFLTPLSFAVSVAAGMGAIAMSLLTRSAHEPVR